MADFPWQPVSKIRPAELDSEDLGAIERDNVSMDFYISLKYVEVLEEFPAHMEPTIEIEQQNTPVFCARNL